MRLWLPLFLIALSHLVLANSTVVVTTGVDEDNGPSSLSDLDDISLREAILYAEDGATITFAPFSESSLPLDLVIQLRGPLRINRSLTIDASQRDGSVTIDAGGNGSDYLDWQFETHPEFDPSIQILEYRCLIIEGAISDRPIVRLAGLTFQNGTALIEGGNIFAYLADLTIEGCHITNGMVFSEQSSIDPYGLRVYEAESALSSWHYRGGAGLSCYDCEVTLLDSQFTNNRILPHSYVAPPNDRYQFRDEPYYGSFPQIVIDHYEILPFPRHCSGAGVSLISSDCRIERCLIASNEARSSDLIGSSTNVRGGGLSLYKCTARLSNCEISGNTSYARDADGAGIHSVTSDIDLDSCSILDNRSEGSSSHGAGMILNGSLENTFHTITNCTIADNHNQGSSGGGINAWSAGLLVNHCTITGNYAPEDVSGSGGGISANSRARVYIQNSIIAENRDSQISARGATISSLGGNVFGSISEDDGDVITSPLDATDVENARLFQLDDYGAYGPTRPLLPYSPALENGVYSIASMDQVGNPRSADAQPDSGAIEHQTDDDWDHLWSDDGDGDGVVLGVELAIGRDPWVADSDSSFAITSTNMTDEGMVLYAPFSWNALAGTRWQITRSTSLTEDFTPIFIYDRGNALVLGEYPDDFYSSSLDPQIGILDPNPPEERAFYRFEILSKAEVAEDAVAE